MTVGTPIPLSEYLETSYDPDVEYVDGILESRNVGDWLHSLVQSNVLFALRRKYPQYKVVPELRSQTAGTRFRLPDISVLTAPPQTRFLITAARIVIEILSEDDRMTTVMEKLAEYETKGIPDIWLIDPRLELVSVYRDGALVRVQADRVVTFDGEVELQRSEIFEN